jgi:hypothetical protein
MAIVRGLVAGAFGTLAMSGVAATVRRTVSPLAPFGETHYERVGVAMTALARGVDLTEAHADPDALLDLSARRRLGEALHMVFGMINGALLAVAVRDVRPRHGVALGVGLWFAGFAGHLPALKVTDGIASMTTQERWRTMSSHVTYGVTTALVLAATARGRDR